MIHDSKMPSEELLGVLETNAVPGRAPTRVSLTVQKLTGRATCKKSKGISYYCNHELRLAYKTQEGKNRFVWLSTDTKCSLGMICKLAMILDPDSLLRIIQFCVDELRARDLEPKKLENCPKG